MFAGDANWGRIIAAALFRGEFDREGNIWLESSAGKEQVTRDGWGFLDEDNAALILKEKDIKVLVDLRQGGGEAFAWTCDLSYEYVRINAEYRT